MVSFQGDIFNIYLSHFKSAIGIVFLFCAWPPHQPNPRLYCSQNHCKESALFIREQYTSLQTLLRWQIRLSLAALSYTNEIY